MSDAIMSVDEVAAHNLLLALGLEPDETAMALAADHMQAHRVAAERFQALKGRDDLLSHLETAFMERDHPDEGAWSAGYAAAEREALAWASIRTSLISPRAPASAGTRLRGMIRAAKAENALVAKAPPDFPPAPLKH